MARTAHLKTKLKLKEGFLSCLETTDFDKIGVSQIAQAAGVSRKTFYYHFTDKNELVQWICIHDMDANADKISVDGPGAFVELIRLFISQNRILYGNALQDMSLGSFGQFFSDILFYQVSGRLRAFYLERFQSRSVANLAITQEVEQGRMLAIIWLLHPSQPSADDLMAFIHGRESVRTKVIGRWLEKDKTLNTFPDTPPFNPTAEDYQSHMTHNFSVRESFEHALDNAKNNHIADERYSVEFMLQRYR